MAVRASSPPVRDAFTHSATATGRTPRKSATSACVRPSRTLRMATWRRASLAAAVNFDWWSSMMPKRVPEANPSEYPNLPSSQ